MRLNTSFPDLAVIFLAIGAVACTAAESVKSPTSVSSSATSASAAPSAPDDAIWVSIPDGGLSCDEGPGARKISESEAMLKKAGVTEVFGRRDGSDGKDVRAAMCGIPKGKEHQFQIRKSDLPKAIAAGFTKTQI